MMTCSVLLLAFGFNNFFGNNPLLLSIQSNTPSEIQNLHDLLLSFSLRYPRLSKVVSFLIFKNFCDLVFLFKIFQHLEVFFKLARAQFRSSINDVCVGANDKKWGTMREGKFKAF